LYSENWLQVIKPSNISFNMRQGNGVVDLLTWIISIYPIFYIFNHVTFALIL